MKKYLGVKIVNAEPAMEPIGPMVDPMRLREGYKVVYEDCYTSWSPKEVFEKAYKPFDDIDDDVENIITVDSKGNWDYLYDDNNSNIDTVELLKVLMSTPPSMYPPEVKEIIEKKIADILNSIDI